MNPGDLVQLRRLKYPTYEVYYTVGIFIGFKMHHLKNSPVVAKTLLLLTGTGLQEYIISAEDPFAGFELVQSVNNAEI